VTALSATHGPIALVVHPTRPQARELAEHARAFWEAHGHPVVELLAENRQPVRDFDLAVSLGGDGTMLRSVQLAAGDGVPVLGVNLGALGYLTAVEPEALEQSFARLLDGDYGVEERMTLDVTVESAGGPQTLIALNEAVLERTAPGHTIRLQVHIGGKAFLSFLADGFLASTPSGSTAYNLSLRGPIVSPRLRAIVLTPIAAHMLFDRSIVLEPEESVVLELLENRPAGLVVDGLDVGTLQPGDAITVRAGAHPARLVAFERGDFYGVLRAKFNLADR
jgi:NAD+ kinase